MASDGDGPAVVAYDGSPPADAAVRATVALLGSRRLLITTAWMSSGPAFALSPLDSSMPGVANAPVDPELLLELEEAGSHRAATIADAGVRLAHELGAQAEPVLLDAPTDPASAIIDYAESCDAAVVVVGARVHRTLRRRVLGSTSEKVLHHCACPVLIVHNED